MGCFDKFAAPKIKKHLLEIFKRLESDSYDGNKGAVADDMVRNRVSSHQSVAV